MSEQKMREAFEKQFNCEWLDGHGHLEQEVWSDSWRACENTFCSAIVAERERCLSIIKNYAVPVGNSAAGEMASEWTIDALRSISKEICNVNTEKNNV